MGQLRFRWQIGLYSLNLQAHTHMAAGNIADAAEQGDGYIYKPS